MIILKHKIDVRHIRHIWRSPMWGAVPVVDVFVLGYCANGKMLDIFYIGNENETWLGLGATVTVHQFFCILHFWHTCSLCRVDLVVQFPARGSTQVLLCLFPGVLWLWHFLYSAGQHPVSSLHIYTFVVSRAFMAGAASQAGDADSSRAPCLTSGLQESVIVHLGALLLVSQWQSISSFVFYIDIDSHGFADIDSHGFANSDVLRDAFFIFLSCLVS